MSEIDRSHIGEAVAGLRALAAADVARGALEREGGEAVSHMMSLTGIAARDLNRVADALERIASTLEEKHA